MSFFDNQLSRPLSRRSMTLASCRSEKAVLPTKSMVAIRCRCALGDTEEDVDDVAAELLDLDDDRGRTASLLVALQDPLLVRLHDRRAEDTAACGLDDLRQVVGVDAAIADEGDLRDDGILDDDDIDRAGQARDFDIGEEPGDEQRHQRVVERALAVFGADADRDVAANCCAIDPDVAADLDGGQRRRLGLRSRTARR